MLAPLLREAGRAMRRVDVGGEPAAARLYGLRVPVLVCGDRELCWGRFDEDGLRAVLGLPARRRRGWPFGPRPV